MNYPHRCLISVAAMIALATIAAMQYGEDAMAQPRGGNASNDAVSDDLFLPAQQPAASPDENPLSPAEPSAASPNEDPFSSAEPAAAQLNESPFVPVAQPRADVDDATPPLRNLPAPSAFNKLLFRAAQEAYEQSIAEFRAGKVTDPEAVYRWSLRWMKAEEPLEDKAAPAARQHHRRMSDLAELVDKKTSETSDLHKLAVNYYRAEAEMLLEQVTSRTYRRKTKPPADELSAGPLPQPRASAPKARGPEEYGVEAYQTAQACLNAVLQGNFEAATALSRPGSAAGSRPLLVHFNELVDPEIVRIQGVHYPEPGKGRALAYTADVQLTKALTDGRNKVPLAITLMLEKGRWLVTDLNLGGKELQQWIRTQAAEPFPRREPFPREPFAGLSGTRVPDEEPAESRQTKVFALKHADAQQLRRTLVDLLSGTFKFNMEIDERTNTLLVHGTVEGIEAVAALITILDTPSRRPAAGVDSGDDVVPGQRPPPGGGYGSGR